jgi:hypothetical protein
MKRILIFALLLIVAAPTIFAQATASGSATVVANSIEATLVAKEKQKWEALKNGGWLSLKDMFAEDFLSIGYEPDGTVRMTTKAQSFSQENRLPPGIEFALSDFKVISAGKDSAVVTYTATGPIKVHATSVWAKRGEEWKTVFYQATMTR